MRLAARRGALALWVLLLPGCAMRSMLGMEAPGRPAVAWQAAATDSSRAHADSERQLLAELRNAEAQRTDDLALATTLYNLAILRRQQGELAEAEQLYQRAVAIRER